MALQTLPTRPFGSAAEDLAFDFGNADRPALVTALLDACTPGAETNAWWERPVGERVSALLALLRRSSGEDAIALTLRCASADCDARFDIALPHDALPQAPASAPVTLRGSDGRTKTLRLPTGDDLRAWHAQPPATRAQMLARLRVDPGVDDESDADDADLDEAAAALADADPLVAFAIACACPECGRAAEREVDLEDLALQRLEARQHGLLREVHALASHYGWTEREILAVAAPRRARYLALIEGDGA